MAENKTPTLYKLYDKEYSYDDLQRLADLGLNDYIMRLRRGEKDEQRFKDAYYNLMSGIKDGTITFDNGKYHDSKGRYFNGVYYDEEGNKLTSKKKTKDYYGLIANYIYNTLRGMNEYTKPEDPAKIKWNGNKSVGLALTRNIFNSDAFNYRTYLDSDVDSYDESTNKIGTKNRVACLRNALLNTLNNFDNVFTGYTDDDKAKAILNIQEAINSLNDGISPTDYLPLERAAGGLDYRKMFIDTYKPKLEVELEQLELEAQLLLQQLLLSSEQAFKLWAETNHPRATKNFSNFTLTSGRDGKSYGDYTNNRIKYYISKLSSDLLTSALLNILYNKSYIFNDNFNRAFGKYTKLNYSIQNSTALTYILNELANRNMLLLNGDSYYFKLPKFKHLSLKLTGNKLEEISDWDNPFLAQLFINEYKQSNGGAYSDIYTNYVASLKNGGVLKALTGVKLKKDSSWYNEVFIPQLDHILNWLDKDKNYYTWLNDMQDRHSEIYNKASKEDFSSNAYKDDNNLVGIYQDEYKKGFNGEWGDNSVGYNSLGIQNAQNHGVFDLSGRKRTSGDWGGDNKYKTDNLFSNITDYRRLLGRKGDFSSEQLNEIRNKFKEKGYNFIEGKNGYYKLDFIGSSNNEEVSKLTDLNLDDKTKGTNTTPRSENPSKIYKTPFPLINDLIEAKRVFLSHLANKKIEDTIAPSLRPAFKSIYELYSPITGAFSEMLLRNRQGADLSYMASTPITSDASLQAAREFDAAVKKHGLLWEGFLADDREIKRTAAEALKRQENNKVLRTQVHDENVLRMLLALKDLALLKAIRIGKDYTSTDNFMLYLKNKMDTEIEKRRTFNLQSETTNIDNQYQDALYGMQERINKWRVLNPDKDITSMEGYSDYLKARRNLDSWRKAKYQEAYGNIYGYRYDSPYNYKTAEEIANFLRIAKKGGILVPKLMK